MHGQSMANKGGKLTTLVMAISDEIRCIRETSLTDLVSSVILRSVPTEKVLEIKQESVTSLECSKIA